MIRNYVTVVLTYLCLFRSSYIEVVYFLPVFLTRLSSAKREPVEFVLFIPTTYSWAMRYLLRWSFLHGVNDQSKQGMFSCSYSGESLVHFPLAYRTMAAPQVG